MSVLIKWMEMPKNCEDCPMCHSTAEYDYAYCCVSSAETTGARRPNDCPLIELPDHGDLIDRDDVENAALMIWVHNSNGDDAMEQTIEHIRHNIAAVIPAERSEDGET